MPTQIHGLEVATRSKTKSRKGLSGLGSQFATEINGQLLTCKKYKRGPSGEIRCAAMKPGAKGGGSATPSSRARKSAGVKSRFNSKRAGVKKRSSKSKAKRKGRKCVRYKKVNGVRRCAKFSGTKKSTTKRKSSKRPANKGRKCTKYKTVNGVRRCAKFGGKRKSTTKRSSKGKRKCTKYKTVNGVRRCAKFSGTKKSATKRSSRSKSSRVGKVEVSKHRAMLQSGPNKGKLRKGCTYRGAKKNRALCKPSALR